MPTTQDTRVVAPIRAPQRGLLATIPPVTSVPGYEITAKWGYGLQWLTENPPFLGGQVQARAIGCDLPDTPLDVNDFAHPPTELADPFSVLAVDWCSVLGFFGGNEWQGRSRRELEAAQSFLIAQEFWLGTLAQAQGNNNTWLADAASATTVTSPTAVHKAIAALDNYAADLIRNGQAYLHMTPQVLNLAMAADAVWRDGNLWRTAWGSIVVADGGYTGTLDGQGDDGDWIIATTKPEIVLGPIRDDNGEDDVSMQAIVDTRTNDVTVFAERDVIVLWDPQVLHGAVQVDLT